MLTSDEIFFHSYGRLKEFDFTTLTSQKHNVQLKRTAGVNRSCIHTLRLLPLTKIHVQMWAYYSLSITYIINTYYTFIQISDGAYFIRSPGMFSLCRMFYNTFSSFSIGFSKNQRFSQTMFHINPEYLSTDILVQLLPFLKRYTMHHTCKYVLVSKC